MTTKGCGFHMCFFATNSMMSLTLSPQQLMEIQRRVTVRTIGVVQVHSRASKRKQKTERGLLKYTTKFLRTQEVCLDSNHTGFCQGTESRSVMLTETRSRKRTKIFFFFLFTTQALLTKCYLTQLTVLTLLTTPYSLIFLHRKKKRKLQLQLLTTNNLN